MFAGIFKSVLWVFVLTVPFLMLMPTAGARLTGWQLSIGTLFGGFVFGIGAAINGACAFSTLARLADGQLAMLGALGGFIGGILGYFSLVGSGWLIPPSPSPSMVGPLIALAMLIVLPLIAWAVSKVFDCGARACPGPASWIYCWRGNIACRPLPC
jgi:uncharacterized membrane protein YedE/YeeE